MDWIESINWIELLLGYLIAINLVGFIAMAVDKSKAKHRARRISEKSLLALAIIGASPGVWFSMYVFHHKTKKRKFSIGLPVILILQLVLVLLFTKM
ncbi:MAG: DUF1294 domain-containing protein [Clostridiales bacterium]|nr:DUF1294 domain-containing protein [Clostridiales bacterium]